MLVFLSPAFPSAQIGKCLPVMPACETLVLDLHKQTSTPLCLIELWLTVLNLMKPHKYMVIIIYDLSTFFKQSLVFTMNIFMDLLLQWLAA